MNTPALSFDGCDVRLYFRGPTNDATVLQQLLTWLEARTYFAPTHFGSDERKKKKYKRDQALALIAEGQPTLYLWHRGMRNDCASMDIIAESPVDATFNFAITPAESRALLEDYIALVEASRPCLADVWPAYDWDQAHSLYPEAIATLAAHPSPDKPALVGRLGPGILSPLSFVNDHFADRLGPALLRELAAEKVVGGYWIFGRHPEVFDDLKGFLERSVTSIEALRRHGLAGLMRSPLGPFLAGPKWTAPEDWHWPVSARIERDIVGFNT